MQLGPCIGKSFSASAKKLKLYDAGWEEENTARKILKGVIRTLTESPFQAAGLSIPRRLHSDKGQLQFCSFDATTKGIIQDSDVQSKPSISTSDFIWAAIKGIWQEQERCCSAQWKMTHLLQLKFLVTL